MISNNFSAETEFLKLIVKLITKVQLDKSEECSIGYSEAFKSNSDFTEFISKVVDKVAEEQGLKHWREYYTLDHVLYKEEDRIPEGVLPFGSSCVQGIWLKHFRLIIEHENSLDAGGGYQEFSKLMLFNADMKVLMGYANKGDNYDAYAKDYQRIYASVGLSSDIKPILFIGEYADAHFDAYLITTGGLLTYQWDANIWAALPLETEEKRQHKGANAPQRSQGNQEVHEVGDVIDVNCLQHLLTFREQTLGMSKIGNLWSVNLSKCFKNVAEPFCLTSEDGDLNDGLRTCLWHGETTEEGASGDFLTELKWKITMEGGRPFMEMTGEFCGTHPLAMCKGVDFSSSDLQPVIEKFESSFHCLCFGDEELCKHVSHDSSRICWRTKEPLDVFGDGDLMFPAILSHSGWYVDIRGEIINFGEKLAELLSFLIPVNTPKPRKKTSRATTKEEKGRQFLEQALDYDFGRNGKSKDATKAVEYYEKCLGVMESGLAYYNLALSYLNGDGVNKDKKKGYSLMWKSEQMGYPSASFYLAKLFEADEDGEADFSKAAELYKHAVDNGHIEAAYRLGLLLKKGNGVERNPDEAFRMFGIAVNADAESIKPEYLYEYAMCHFRGVGTKECPANGIDAMRKAAEAGYADAQFEMAQAYECGWGVEKDNRKRWEWMRRAADGGNMDAEFQYGEYLLPKSPESAIEYLQRAAWKNHAMAEALLLEAKEKATKAEVETLTGQAENGLMKAQYKLGMMYLKGDKVKRNTRLGFDWLSEAANQGDVKALAELGWCYLEGVGVPRPNPNRAFDCFSEAAGSIKSSKNTSALKGLYECYSKGLGTERDRKLASDIKFRLDILRLYGNQ